MSRNTLCHAMDAAAGLEPPGEIEVARRALCLGVVGALAYAAFDLGSNGAAAREVQDWADGLRAWIVQEGLAPALSPVEREWFEKPLGEWNERDKLDAAWRHESLGVLVWAISMLDVLPPYDRPFEGVFDLLPFGASSAEWFDRSKLRHQEDIQRARDVAELWHWRARTTQLEDQPGLREQHPDVDLHAIVSRAAAHAHERGDIPQPIEGDFPAFGRAYRDLDAEQLSLATSIAMERHYTLNWLCGYSSDWDEVPTDT